MFEDCVFKSKFLPLGKYRAKSIPIIQITEQEKQQGLSDSKFC